MFEYVMKGMYKYNRVYKIIESMTMRLRRRSREVHSMTESVSNSIER